MSFDHILHGTLSGAIVAAVTILSLLAHKRFHDGYWDDDPGLLMIIVGLGAACGLAGAATAANRHD